MTADCDHDRAPKPSKREIASALEAAEARGQSTGRRLTPQRRRAFEMLVAAGEPVKAYDLMANFKQGATTAPPTIYRALEALVEMGLAHRIASMNAYVACHGVEEGHAASFLICDCCGSVEEVHGEGPVLEALGRPRAFVTQTIEAHGRCRRCQA